LGIVRERCHAPGQASDVLTASTLGLQPASGTERLKQAAKQAVVIEHPMEGCGADDSVESGGKREVQQVCDDDLGAGTELRLQEFTSGARHVLRDIERNHAPVGQGLQQVGGEAAGAAAGVKNQFPLGAAGGKELFSPN
jgi:hypothetical protein